MSEHWSLSNGPEDPTPEGAVAPPSGSAIPLPAAGAGPAPVDVGVDPTGELRPTGPTPVVQGPPTPPAGTWMPPTGSVWAPGPPTGSPYPGGYAGGYAAGGVPPVGGWPAPGFSHPAPQAPAPKKGKGAGMMAGLAGAAAVVVLVAGVGIGHAVWPSQSTAASASAPASGSSGGTFAPSGGGSTGGSSTSPYGNGSSGGSSTSPFGNGSTGTGGGTSTGAGAPSDISSIAAKVDPALVDINTNLSYQNEQAAGTGMVLTSDGVILTNNHVIDGATSISVTDVGNGKTYSANVLGYDRTGDVAVIKLVSASGLQTITTAGGNAAVGQAVVGVGNAGGTGGTPSTAGGSVTATNQSITASDDNGGNSENLTGLIETNADIQPGDSGGSLVNTSGQVIGMDTAASTGSGYQVSGSQGYAIPIATALSLARQIEAGNASSTIHIGATGFLGVSVEDAGGSSGGSSGDGSSGGGFGGFGSSSGGGSSSTATSGAQVDSTLSGSPSAKAGLVQGDVITGLDGKTVGSANDLTNLLQSHHPGDSVQLTWTDTSGQSQSASVTLTTGPPA